MFDYKIQDSCLKGKTILITGAGDGIGKQAALTYAELGATVILLGRTVEKLESVYDEIVAAGNPEPAIVPLDMKGATKQHYIDMTNTIVDQFGKLDGALLNASVLGELTPFVNIHEQTFDDVMQINVKAQLMLSQALISALQKAEHGSLVFTTSTVGGKGRAFWATYSMSKFATEGMMELIADEYEGTNLRANAINPGGTRTAMRATAYPGENPDTLATPKDIMPLYVYLMSDDSVEITGQVLKAQ